MPTASQLLLKWYGTLETFRNLVFHEGPGLALEMRLFTKGGVENDLRAAGFHKVEWSRPAAARKQVRK